MNPQFEKCLELLHGKVSDAVFNDLFAKLDLLNVTDRRCSVLLPPKGDVKSYLPYKVLLEISWGRNRNLRITEEKAAEEKIRI